MKIGKVSLKKQRRPRQPNVHLPGATLPNEFGNQRKEKNRKTTCEQPASHTTWSSRKESIEKQEKRKKQKKTEKNEYYLL